MKLNLGYEIEASERTDEVVLYLEPEFAKKLAIHAVHAEIPFAYSIEGERTVIVMANEDVDKILRCDIKIKSFIKI